MALEQYLPNRRQSLADGVTQGDDKYWIPTTKILIGAEGLVGSPVSSANPLPVTTSDTINVIEADAQHSQMALREVLKELRKLNFQISNITGIELSDEDIDQC